ncbi:MAG: hypothetical protein ACRCS9_13975 [Hyphomicrobium sp.]
MTQAQPHTTGRYRHTWRAGEQYLPGDRCVVGAGTFESLQNQVSGPRSQPGVGEHWTMFWAPVEGYLVHGPNVTPFPAAPVQAQITQQSPQPQGLLAAGPYVAVPPVIADQLRRIAGIPPEADEPVLPPSDTETALAIDSLSIRMERAEAEAAKMRDLVAGLAKHLGQANIPAVLLDNPIRTEAWRRKAAVLNASDRAEAEELFKQMLAQGYKLLRKRDRGDTWTSQEAARAAVLDTLHDQLERIDDAAASLEHFTPDDITADRHWPRLGDAS